MAADLPRIPPEVQPNRTHQAPRPLLPTRLIDIGLDGETHWKLCIPSKGQISPSAAYMTLSYSWGESADHIKLLSSNLDDFRRGRPIRDLPWTLFDLVGVARRFSVRYVWIDSLCIM